MFSADSHVKKLTGYEDNLTIDVLTIQVRVIIEYRMSLS